MNLELYLAFVVAASVLIVVPGPNVMLIVAHSLGHGPRRALMTVAGTNVCQAIQLAITCVGMASILLFVAPWFESLRWAGVAAGWRLRYERPLRGITDLSTALGHYRGPPNLANRVYSDVSGLS